MPGRKRLKISFAHADLATEAVNFEVTTGDPAADSFGADLETFGGFSNREEIGEC